MPNQDPFSDFINTNTLSTNGASVKNFEKLDPSTDFTKRLLCGFQLGSDIAMSTPVSAGRTGCGLGAILNFGEESGLFADQSPYNNDFCKIYGQYIIRSPEALIAKLNAIHNYLNQYMWYMDPANGAVANNLVTNASFNFWKNYLFPGAYNSTTGNENYAAFDPMGGGITDCFVVTSASYPVWNLSRAGYEFYTLLSYLSYGGMAAVNTVGWNTLSTLSDNRAQAGSLASRTITPEGTYVKLDAVATLEMCSYLDGQQITSAATNNQAVYAGATYTYGNTLAYTQGVGATMLNGNFANTVKRNNIVNSFLNENAPNYGKNAKTIIIHAGLSGADISVQQDSITRLYTDVYRYPGFDGRSSSYQNIQNVAGLTAYTLVEDPSLNRTICIMGKKRKTIYSPNFGDPNANYLLDIEIPLVGDVAGILNLAKQQGLLYGPITGGSGLLLNADSVVPNISPSSDTARTLKAKRINFCSSGSQGIGLGSDLVGATGTYTINDRYGIVNLNTSIYNDGITILEPFAGKYNNANTRADVVSALSNMLNANNPGYTKYFKVNDPNYPSAPNGYTIQCDNNNNGDGSSVLNAKITYYPLTPISNDSPVTTVNLTVSAEGLV